MKHIMFKKDVVHLLLQGDLHLSRLLRHSCTIGHHSCWSTHHLCWFGLQPGRLEDVIIVIIFEIYLLLNRNSRRCEEVIFDLRLNCRCWYCLSCRCSFFEWRRSCWWSHRRGEDIVVVHRFQYNWLWCGNRNLFLL